ncbi:uncharacterized protein LOC120009758 isoform X2 [Tripterygium wilfordii]|uniref:uncharacterized protein LOC120009758 isoform X2 n=1 Tax=Tripterygium wilfordii TaxID=458696 RepID=UPI0018F7ECBB|nr:uncharacterized protein LOC120009758 isoform X2 [Tripterygium wilfordii]
MASSKSTAFLALLLVLLAVIAVGDDVLSDFNEMVCEEVNCGKGRCKAGIGYAFNYICKCDRGWKRTEDDDVNDAAPFLPCVIPNCSLDYSCQPAPPPLVIGRTAEKEVAQGPKHIRLSVRANQGSIIFSTPLISHATATVQLDPIVHVSELKLQIRKQPPMVRLGVQQP